MDADIQPTCVAIQNITYFRTTAITIAAIMIFIAVMISIVCSTIMDVILQQDLAYYHQSIESRMML
jgi:hypothetical protein